MMNVGMRVVAKAKVWASNHWGTVRWQRFDERGNVLMLTAFALVPLTMAIGVAVDYSKALRAQTKMNAAADAAALAGVTQPMMRKTDDEARLAAIAMFNAQASTLVGVTYNPANLVVTVSTAAGDVTTRQISVSYTADSLNNFSGILNNPAIPIGGTSKSKAAVAPNVDFYVMLDTSPSMALPATTLGIVTMTDKTGGCAFACHQTDISGAETVVSNGVRMSYYAYARSQNVILRTDLVTAAVQDLTDVATVTASQNNAVYRMALSDFDYMYRDIVATPTTPSVIRTAAAQATLLPYCRNNQRVCNVGDNDQATNFTAAFAGASATLPAVSGNGTSAIGDTPQAMLFIITDGMRDEDAGGRQMGPIPTTQCAAIKARGIKIAVLYTEYLASAASDGWSIANVRNPYLSPTDNISPALINCASSGLFYKVTTDGDISQALTTLFRRAISLPRLVQ
jgi:Flp pilus assembly protein TadG